MVIPPTIHKTDKGRRYFILNRRRVYVDDDLTISQIRRMYRALKKHANKRRKKLRRKATYPTNRASAIIKQYILAGKQQPTGPTVIQRDNGDKDFLLQSILQKLSKQDDRPQPQRAPPQPQAVPQPLRQAVPQPIRQAAAQPIAVRHAPPRILPLPSPRSYRVPRVPVVNRPRENASVTPSYSYVERRGRQRTTVQRHQPPQLHLPESSPQRGRPRIYTPRLSAQELAELHQPDLRPRGTPPPPLNYVGFDPPPLELAGPEHKEEDVVVVPQPEVVLDVSEGDAHIPEYDALAEKLFKDQRKEYYRLYTYRQLQIAVKEFNSKYRNAPGLKKIPTNQKSGKMIADLLQGEVENFKLGIGVEPAPQPVLALPKKPSPKKPANNYYQVLPADHPFGFGKGEHQNGLYDDEIDRVMDMYPEFAGVISRDEIKKILPKVEHGKKICWIMNLDPASKAGSHWVAVYIDPVGSKSVEFFDSFGREIPPDIQHDVKLVVDILKPNTFLKLKSNHVIHQDDSTNNCGYFAMKFLIDRLRGKSFAEASGYDDKMRDNKSEKYEAEIERLKKVPPFSYLN